MLVCMLGCKKSTPPTPLLTLPSISSISPSSGNAGTTVTITGSNFETTASDNTVKFNGMAATVTSASSTSLIVIAPAGGSTGTIRVSTSSGSVNGPTFTYLALQVPTIVSITPDSASVGTTVTITGTNFKTTATDNTVKFNGVVATVTSATATTIVTTVPTSGTSGNITVTTSGGTATGPQFTYEAIPDIYLVGQSNTGWGYWKNGQFTVLPDCVLAQAIFVNGTDVYVAGAGATSSKYWKNGIGISLPEPAGAQSGRASSIFVSGSDVFVCGYDAQYPIGTQPLYWKNGNLIPISLSSGNINPGLPAIGGQANSIFVSGTDVYLAGAQLPYNGSNAVATYWKNGTPIILTSTTLTSTAPAYATGVYASGSDVYVAGYLEGASQNYWKNGAAFPISIPDTNQNFFPSGIYVENNGDVLICGDYGYSAKYWKNGTMNDLTNTPYNNASGGSDVASSITVNGEDIYITGNYFGQGAGYWKNSVFHPLSGALIVKGIAVK